MPTIIGRPPAPAAPSFMLDGQYTVAQIMALSPSANYRKDAWCTDLFGAGGFMRSNGVTWKPVSPFGVGNIANSNAALTLRPLLDPPTILAAGALTAARAWNISTQYAYVGQRFRVTRTAGGLFNLVVNGLGLPLNNWADFEYDGTAFVKTASGGLL